MPTPLIVVEQDGHKDKAKVEKLLDDYVQQPGNIVLMVRRTDTEADRLDEWAKMCPDRGIAVINYTTGEELTNPSSIEQLREWEEKLKHGGFAVSTFSSLTD